MITIRINSRLLCLRENCLNYQKSKTFQGSVHRELLISTGSLLLWLTYCQFLQHQYMSLYILTVDLAPLNTLNVCLKYTLLEKEAPVYKCLTEENVCLMTCSNSVVQET